MRVSSASASARARNIERDDRARPSCRPLQCTGEIAHRANIVRAAPRVELAHDPLRRARVAQRRRSHRHERRTREQILHDVRAARNSAHARRSERSPRAAPSTSRARRSAAAPRRSALRCRSRARDDAAPRRSRARASCSPPRSRPRPHRRRSSPRRRCPRAKDSASRTSAAASPRARRARLRRALADRRRIRGRPPSCSDSSRSARIRRRRPRRRSARPPTRSPPPYRQRHSRSRARAKHSRRATAGRARRTSATPGFASPIALSIPPGVSTTRSGGAPFRGNTLTAFVKIPPSASRSITSAISRPYAAVPEASMTGFWKRIPATSTARSSSLTEWCCRAFARSCRGTRSRRRRSRWRWRAASPDS